MKTFSLPTTLSPARSGLATRLTSGWRRLTERIARDFARPALNQRVLFRLATLSDRELADIGLGRADLAEAALPENGDATRFLVARRDERHQARHGRRPF